MTADTPEVLCIYCRNKYSAERVDFALGHYRHLVHLSSYIENRWHEPIQLADAAAAIGISPSRLSHLFLEKTGVSFRDWLRFQRVEKATRLLAKDDKPIREVAFSVGYRNARTFERSFVKITGVTPFKYRKLIEAQAVSRIRPYLCRFQRESDTQASDLRVCS